jgi:hypothetical protein
VPVAGLPRATLPPAPNSPAPNSPVADPPAWGSVQPLSSEGGSVDAACANTGQARLSSWEPAKGHVLDEVDPGPAAIVSVTFRRGKTFVEMVVTCRTGTASAEITRTTS